MVIKMSSPTKNMFIMAITLTILLIIFTWNSSVVETASRLNHHEEHIALKSEICSWSSEEKRRNIIDNTSLNMIFFITPTYSYPEQLPELTRLGQTLMHVPRIHWIVADDSEICNPYVENILIRTGLPYTHIMSPMPEYYRKNKSPPRGVANRRAALDWLHTYTKSGVIYFGDDDNTFDLRLFDEIRNTQKISMFPVGLIGEYGVSSPVVHNGKVVGFFDSWPARRTWPIDMAGFAININFLKPNSSMPFKAGFEEDRFLQSNLVTLDDIEPKANNCTEILVWHTQTKKHPVSKLALDIKTVESKQKHFNLAVLIKEVAKMGMSSFTHGKSVTPYITQDGKPTVLK